MSEKDKDNQEHQASENERPGKGSGAADSSAGAGPGRPGEEGSPEAAAATSPEAEREMPEHGPAGHKASKREAELKALRQERDELKDKYLRALAEMENLRKRSEREKSEYFQYALAEVLQDVLSVVDSLERALQTGDQRDGKLFVEGVRMIHRQLLDFLARRGVTPIPQAAGSRFDPGIHQALSSEEADDVQEAVVSEELQRGYRLHDRLLRPALVKVKIPRPPTSD